METAILIMVIVAALFAMQVYLKRGIQGRLRLATVSIGEQYDPNATNATVSIRHASNTVTTTNVTPIVRDVWQCPPGYGPESGLCSRWTNSVVATTSQVETLYDITNKSGTETVGGF